MCKTVLHYVDQSGNMKNEISKNTIAPVIISPRKNFPINESLDVGEGGIITDFVPQTFKELRTKIVNLSRLLLNDIFTLPYTTHF